MDCKCVEDEHINDVSKGVVCITGQACLQNFTCGSACKVENCTECSEDMTTCKVCENDYICEGTDGACTACNKSCTGPENCIEGLYCNVNICTKCSEHCGNCVGAELCAQCDVNYGCTDSFNGTECDICSAKCKSEIGKECLCSAGLICNAEQLCMGDKCISKCL